jgi:uncharacterized protein (DUF2267 family)
MVLTGLEGFDTSVQKTQSWIIDVANAMGEANRHKALQALRGTLHALRDRLPLEEAVHLGAQMPTLLRGLYYESWVPGRNPQKHNRDEFLAAVRAAFHPAQEVDTEHAARAVFTVLTKRISRGEMKDVRSILPEEIRTLWPASVGANA